MPVIHSRILCALAIGIATASFANGEDTAGTLGNPHVLPASSCAEARNTYNAAEDGYYTLSLEVDAAPVATYTGAYKLYREKNAGCGIRDESSSNWPTLLEPGFQTQGGYRNEGHKCLPPYAGIEITVIRTNLTVYCHMMGQGPKDANEVPRAYVEVDASSNSAQFQYGYTMFTTSFSKLRFDERTQLIYTADCKF